MNEISGIHSDRSCPNCGEGNDRQNAYCVRCGRSLQKGRRRVKASILLFGLISLALAGISGYFIAGGFESKLVGRVNGEGRRRGFRINSQEENRSGLPSPGLWSMRPPFFLRMRLPATWIPRPERRSWIYSNPSIKRDKPSSWSLITRGIRPFPPGLSPFRMEK